LQTNHPYVKPHLTLILHEAPPTAPLPHWERFITDKKSARTALLPAVDAVFAQYKRQFWVGSEYQMAEQDWSEVEKAHGLDRVFRIVFQDERGIPPTLIQQLKALDEVESVRSGKIGKSVLPVARASSLSTRKSSDWSHAQIALADAHTLTQGHPEIIVAVLDTGVDLQHPELVGNLLKGYDFVDILAGTGEFFGDSSGADDDPLDELVGHGTHVAGIIAAKGIGMPIGVAPRCKILPVRVLGAVRGGNAYVGAGLVDNINNGIKWAVDQGAHVINMSLGIAHDGGGLPHEDMMRYAESKGCTVVAASGNDGTPERYYPGALANVIAVGATDRAGEVTPFTSFGKVTCVAPGQEIFSAHVKQNYAFASGTSQAAPFVAGAVALLYSLAWTRGVRLSPKQVRYILSHTADRQTTDIRTPKSGYGRLHVADALRLLDHKLQSAISTLGTK
jgi:subtilisin family serine protease